MGLGNSRKQVKQRWGGIGVGCSVGETSNLNFPISNFSNIGLLRVPGSASVVQDTASATGVSNYPDEQDIDIIATYSDTSGAIRISRVKMRDLSASWVWENPMDVHHDQSTSSEWLNHLNLG
nr:putative galacturonosyltransferase 3 [Quercus suber]